MLRPLTPFENWLYHARDENGQSHNTNMLSLLDGCEDTHDEAMRIVNLAFEAGLQAGLNMPWAVVQETTDDGQYFPYFG